MSTIIAIKEMYIELVRTADYSPRQMAILFMVQESQGLFSMSKAAELMEVTKPAITRAVDALVDCGLVDRNPNHNDRRRVCLHTTILGDKLLRTIERAFNDTAGRVTTKSKY